MGAVAHIVANAHQLYYTLRSPWLCDDKEHKTHLHDEMGFVLISKFFKMKTQPTSP